MASAPGAAKPLDFRFLDEGLGGGQGQKRKRDEQGEEATGEGMDTEEGTAGQLRSRGRGRREEEGVGSGTVPATAMALETGPGGKRRKVGEGLVQNAGKVSGRKWKEPRAHRSSLMRNAGGLRRTKTNEERERQRQVDKAYRERKEELKEGIRQSKREKRARTEEKKRRKEENALKGVKVQIISNPKTLKKMSKKQLKQLVKVPG